MNRILKRLWLIIRISVLSFLGVVFVTGLVLLLDLSEVTNITGAYEVHPDEKDAYQWVEDTGGVASRTYRGIAGNVDYVTFAGKQNVHLLDLGKLKSFSKLRRLNLSNSSASDENIAGLNELTQLHELDIYGTNITEEGLLQLVLPHVRFFDVTNIHKNGIDIKQQLSEEQRQCTSNEASKPE